MDLRLEKSSYGSISFPLSGNNALEYSLSFVNAEFFYSTWATKVSACITQMNGRLPLA